MDKVIAINKDKGITSFDTVVRVKDVLKVKKGGHCGTLDPLATGVLLVCTGEATKITDLLSDMEKEYVAIAKLGEATDTFDSDGKMTKETKDFEISLSQIEQALRNFVGDVKQIPPMYSAIKFKGKPLYSFARKGIEIERKPRLVNIKKIEMMGFNFPFLKIKILCSKGTYIRSLCNDIGNTLGVGAHIVELTRTRIGSFLIEECVKTQDLAEDHQAIISLDLALNHLPEIILNEEDFKKTLNGNPIKNNQQGIITDNNYNGLIRLKSPDGNLFGIGKFSYDSILIKRLFNKVPSPKYFKH